MPDDRAHPGAPPLISVLTPTYDRAELLPRLYESLLAQTQQAFEWIVIDDGSEDGTEQLVAGWADTAPFPIVYRRQPNGGKHVALNRAFALARGEYSAMIDSDDAYLPQALERLLAIWATVPAAERERFASVEARCCLPDGSLVGPPLPAPVIDSDYFAIWAQHGAGADTVGLFRTAVLAAHRFPEDDTGVLVTEALIWHRVALAYRTRFVDEVLKVNHYQPSGLSGRSAAAWVRDARPMRQYYGELATMPRPMPRRVRLHAAANAVRYGLHAGAGPLRQWRDAPHASHRRLLLLTAPAGAGAYARDRVRVARERAGAPGPPAAPGTDARDAAAGSEVPADGAIAVAVVSWNTRELLASCLDSLRADADAGLAEVWVVDNGSRDGSRELVRERYPWATLVTPADNLGFGPAVNLVAERTRTPWLVAANADVALEPGALRTLRATAAGDPGIGVVGPRLLLLDGSPQNSVRPFPGLLSALLIALHAARFSRRAARSLRVDGQWEPAPGEALPWLTGALLLISRRAFDEVGGFDPSQWLYAEDMDLCWRMHRDGWTVRYEPAAVAHHAHSAASAQQFADSELLVHVMAVTYLWMLRRRGAAITRLTALTAVAGAVVQLLAERLKQARGGRGATAAAAAREAARAELRGHLLGLRSRRVLERRTAARRSG